MRELAEIGKGKAFTVDLVTDDFLFVIQSGSRELDAVFLVNSARSSDGSFHGAMVARVGLALFGVVRETKPVVCIQTGAAYGVSSIFLPKAIALNGLGKLYSIDLSSFTGEEEGPPKAAPASPPKGGPAGSSPIPCAAIGSYWIARSWSSCRAYSNALVPSISLCTITNVLTSV